MQSSIIAGHTSQLLGNSCGFWKEFYVFFKQMIMIIVIIIVRL